MVWDLLYAALGAVRAMDIGEARARLGQVPADIVARQLLPAAQALLTLAAERAAMAPRAPGPQVSPVCAQGYCYPGVPCYDPDCTHKCHQEVPPQLSTGVTYPEG
jgi:hypothetical protein